MRRLVPLVASLLVSLTVARAQEETAPAPEAAARQQDPNALLARALRNYKGLDDLVVTAEVEHQAAAVAGMPAGAQVLVVAGAVGREFEGEVEAWRDADGRIVVLSRAELPGFALFRNAERTIVQQTYETETVALNQLEAELCAILERDRFLTHFMNAELKPTRDEQTGRWTFRGAVDRRIVRVTPPRVVGGVAVPMPGQTKVLRTEGALVVSPEGALLEASVRVVRSESSPMHGMRVRMGNNGRGGIQLEEAGRRDDDEHDKEGGSTVYTLHFGEPRPSARAKAFKETASRMAGRAGAPK